MFSVLLGITFLIGGIIWANKDKIHINKIAIGTSGVGIEATTDDLVKGISENPIAVVEFKDQIKSATAHIRHPDTFWVYLGETRQHNEKVFITRLFNIGALPTMGEKIESIAAVSERIDRPRRIGVEWLLGGLVGILEKGELVEIKEVISISGINDRLFWWAKVSEPQP